MNRNLLYLSTLFLFLGACASTGSGSSGTTVARADTGQAATADEAADPDKVVCRRIRPTGSRMAEKVCKTVSQWEQEAERSQEEIRRSQSGSAVSTAEGG